MHAFSFFVLLSLAVLRHADAKFIQKGEPTIFPYVIPYLNRPRSVFNDEISLDDYRTLERAQRLPDINSQKLHVINDTLCCQPHIAPDCIESGNTTTCHDYVCHSDPYCCNISWDHWCVRSYDLAGSYIDACAGNTCFIENTSSCCAVNIPAGCDHQECEDLVCAFDNSCCSASWTFSCVRFAIDLCPATCPLLAPEPDSDVVGECVYPALLFTDNVTFFIYNFTNVTGPAGAIVSDTVFWVRMAPANITEFEFSVEEHTFLPGPSSTPIKLASQPCPIGSVNFIDAAFNDRGEHTAQEVCTISSGNLFGVVQPLESLAPFVGLTVADRYWSINITALSPDDLGVAFLVGLCLGIKYTTPSTASSTSGGLADPAAISLGEFIAFGILFFLFLAVLHRSNIHYIFTRGEEDEVAFLASSAKKGKGTHGYYSRTMFNLDTVLVVFMDAMMILWVVAFIVIFPKDTINSFGYWISIFIVLISIYLINQFLWIGEYLLNYFAPDIYDDGLLFAFISCILGRLLMLLFATALFIIWSFYGQFLVARPWFWLLMLLFYVGITLELVAVIIIAFANFYQFEGIGSKSGERLVSRFKNS